MKIGGRIFARCFLDRAADPNLPFQFRPVKTKRRERIRLELAAFIALVVRKETEAVRIDSFEQNDTDGWFAVRGSGGEAHGVYVADVGGERSGEPGAELLDRIRVQIGSAKPLRFVFVT